MANDRLFLYDRKRDALVMMSKFYPGSLGLSPREMQAVNIFLQTCEENNHGDLDKLQLEIRTEKNYMDGRSGCVWCGKEHNLPCAAPWLGPNMNEDW